MADIWGNISIDGHKVTAEYIEPDEELPPTPSVTHDWYSNHVRQSQYLLQVQISIREYFHSHLRHLTDILRTFQIVKCDDRTCCQARRSNLRDVLFQRFLPAPFPVSQRPFFIPSSEAMESEKFPSLLVRQSLTLRPNYSRTKEIPYDLYCPSQRDNVEGRTCPTCGVYFATKNSMNEHR